MDIRCRLAHDLNDAFAIIAGHIDFLSDYAHYDPALAAHVEAIRNALWSAAKMVHDCQCTVAVEGAGAKQTGAVDCPIPFPLNLKTDR